MAAVIARSSLAQLDRCPSACEIRHAPNALRVGTFAPSAPKRLAGSSLHVATRHSFFSTPVPLVLSRKNMNSQRSRATPLAASGEVELNRAAPVSTPAVERLLDTIKWNSDGLVVAIAQHVDTGDVLMQAFANRDAVSATLASGHATFWSRSRNSLWTKGESSSNFINVVATYLDCDSDSIIYLGVPDGPSCHTGEHTCFFVRAEDAVAAFGSPAGSAEGVTAKQVIKSLPKSRPLMTLQSLEDTIGSRLQEVRAAAANPAPAVPGKKPSWTARLLSDEKLLCSKIKEEAAELCATLTDKEGSARTASEMADLLYHSMVLMAANGTSMADVLAVLRSRFGVSGIEEKNARKSS